MKKDSKGGKTRAGLDWLGIGYLEDMFLMIGLKHCQSSGMINWWILFNKFHYSLIRRFAGDLEPNSDLNDYQTISAFKVKIRAINNINEMKTQNSG